jgi:hypothetical protein
VLTSMSRPCIINCGGSNSNNGDGSTDPPPPVTDREPRDYNNSEEPLSCEPVTATDCSTFLTFQVDTTGFASATATSTSYATVIMCLPTDLTTTIATTATASAAPTQYMIQPITNQPYDVLTGFTARLQSKNDPASLWVVDAPSAQFWGFSQLPLTSDQVDLYKQDPAVSFIL